MKKVIFIFTALLLFSCNKKDEIKWGNINSDIVHWIILKNQAGENLLDSIVTDHYLQTDITVYKLNSFGKEKVLQNNKVKWAPDVSYFIYMCEYDFEDTEVNYSLVYLRLSQLDVDTIKVEYKMVKGFLYTTNLWYNGELKWTRGIDHEPIEVVK
jgi:hypothetical protein